MSKWNVGKPPVTGWYLVADSMIDQPYCAYYTKSKGWRDMDGDSLNAWVTHWMPTPPMPTATVKPDSASAVQPERCCLDYPRCDCNSPPEPDDDWLCFRSPAQPKVTP